MVKSSELRILIAEDDATSRLLLQATLTQLGYDVTVTHDGAEAWEQLQKPDSPRLAILDWMMPRMDGVEVCRRIRQLGGSGYRYTLLLTAKAQREDIVSGLEAGADDYLVKPFDRHELRCRLAVGKRILHLEAKLTENVAELEEALRHVSQLQGLLPICMHCKKIRDDEDTWLRLESYIEKHTGANFTHSLCDPCLKEHYPEQMERILEKRTANR